MKEYFLKQYEQYEKKEIQSGYRCKTYLLSKKDCKLIYQIYIGNTKYQATKKEYITNLIKSNTSIYQIPQIFNCGESEEFNYLVSEYKDGIEMEKANKDTFDYKKIYKDLSDILLKIHSINVGNEYRVDRRKWSRKKGFICQLYRE